MVRIWEHHRRKSHIGARSGQREKHGLPDTDPYRLPPIIPVVLFHGEKPWRGPKSFSETVGGGAELTPYIPNFAPVIFDLTTRSDAQISGGPTDAARAVALQAPAPKRSKPGGCRPCCRDPQRRRTGADVTLRRPNPAKPHGASPSRASLHTTGTDR
jgi:hypothetical protein